MQRTVLINPPTTMVGGDVAHKERTKRPHGHFPQGSRKLTKTLFSKDIAEKRWQV